MTSTPKIQKKTLKSPFETAKNHIFIYNISKGSSSLMWSYCSMIKATLSVRIDVNVNKYKNLGLFLTLLEEKNTTFRSEFP